MIPSLGHPGRASRLAKSGMANHATVRNAAEAAKEAIQYFAEGIFFRSRIIVNESLRIAERRMTNQFFALDLPFPLPFAFPLAPFDLPFFFVLL